MAPVAITENYYLVLEVEQNASVELIIKSWKRLALITHPDRNSSPGATQAFQLLQQAYETLKDESRRRAYDLILPTIKAKGAYSQSPRPAPPPPSTPQSEAANEAKQIAALQKAKQERAAQLRTRKDAFDSFASSIIRDIRKLEGAIKILDAISAAEAAAEAQKNSWARWIFSPIYKTVEESEEDKALKERRRQERRIEKDLKERRLHTMKENVRSRESEFNKAKVEADAADFRSDNLIRELQAKMRDRENQQRQERERVERERVAREWIERERIERERMAKLREQQHAEWVKRSQEAAEAARRRQETVRRAAEKRQKEKREREEEEAARWRQNISSCSHNGWWPKVQGRTACPECDDIWTYLLKCPWCDMKACPRCQAAIRHRRWR